MSDRADGMIIVGRLRLDCPLPTEIVQQIAEKVRDALIRQASYVQIDDPRVDEALGEVDWVMKVIDEGEFD